MKGLKFALVVISVMAMGLGSANAVIWETDFEDYATGNGGYETVVGQDGWVGFTEAGGSAPDAVVGYSSGEDAYMPGFQWLYIQDTSSADRSAESGQPAHMNGVYRPFDAQTGLVHLEVLYNPLQSESSNRTVSLRDSSDAEQAAIAAMVGSSKKYDDPGDRGTWFFARDADGRQWDLGHTVLKENYYQIVIDADVLTQTYNATVSVGDNYFYGGFTEVVSWTGLSFADAVFDISRVYVESDQSASQWDNFLIQEGTPGPQLPGDVDGSGYVDGADRDLIIANWGKSPATRGEGDLNSDNAVTGLDYTEVITYWNTGTPEPGEAIPEPATICLLALAGTVLLAGRRRR